jgi:agmatinase
MTPMADFDPDAPAGPSGGIYGLPHGADDARVILIPAPWDATTSYRAGTAEGPAAILRASRQVDLYDLETGEPYAGGIHMLEEDPRVRELAVEARAAAEPVISGGGVVEGPGLAEQVATVNTLSTELNRWVRAETERWLDRDRIVGIVGGDHSVPFGAIAAAAARHPGMGILHVDAHADLRRAYEGFTHSHASIMYNVMTELRGIERLVQVGVRDVGAAEQAFIREAGGRVITHFEPDLAALRFGGEPWGDQCARIVAPLPDEVWISFDIDGLDPAYCPHTGTPVPGGLTFAHALYLLRVLGESGRRIVGFDLDEVAPGPGGDEWDGNVGARLLYKLIGWTVRSQSPSR